jgi:hypothetical protein
VSERRVRDCDRCGRADLRVPSIVLGNLLVDLCPACAEQVLRMVGLAVDDETVENVAKACREHLARMNDPMRP